MTEYEELLDSDQIAVETITRDFSIGRLAERCGLVLEHRERLRVEWETHSRRFGPESDETILDALRRAGVL